jgi:hypothetical protein
MQILQHIARAAGKSRVMQDEKATKRERQVLITRLEITNSAQKRQKVKTSELRADQVTLFTSVYDNIVELLLLTKDLMIS